MEQGTSLATAPRARGRRARPAAEPEETKPGFAEEALPHLEAVRRFALRLARGDEARAEDLVQDTYLRAYRGWATYTPDTKCCSWLFTICRNVSARYGELKGYTMEHTATDLGVDDVTELSGAARAAAEQDPEGEFYHSLVDTVVSRALEDLPREYRDAVVLCDLEGLGYDEIASRLGVAGGTIKSRIHRGRKLLRGVLHAYAVEVGHLRPAEERA